MKKKYLKILVVIVLAIILGVVLWTFLNQREGVKIKEDTLVKQYWLEYNYLLDFTEADYTLDDPKVILNPYEISPLTALIMFKTETEEQVQLTVVGKDEHTTISHTFDNNKEHILPVYGLYADYENTVIIKVGEIEKEITIQTDPLPDNFVLPTNITSNKNYLGNELYFVTIALRGYNAAYDINGDPRWYLIGNYAWDIQRLDNGRIMMGSNRPIAPPYHTVGLVEMDLTGKIYNEYVMPGGYHHDVFEMADGNLLVASNNFVHGTVEDIIVLIDRQNGEVLKEWDLKEILPQTAGKSAMWTSYDWFHNNSVWYDDETNSIVLSGRHQDAVISIDYDSGELNWIIGDNTNWGEDMEQYFFTPIGSNFEWQWAQHDAQVTPNGDIFILDNGNNRSKVEGDYVQATDNYTRGVIYKINTADMTIEQLWQYGQERGSDFYSPYISNVSYYDEGHYLIHSGGIGKLDGEAINVPAPAVTGAETTSITVEILNNEVIFELELPSNFYRAKKMGLYTENNFQFADPKRRGTLGETPVYQSEEKINLRSAHLEIPEEYQVEFTKEPDRLAFSARLTEGTRVRIILDRFFSRRTYALTATTRAYTAMCIDIFTEEDDIINGDEINVNSYINSDGLSGKYNIYLQIEDKLYNTMQYVEF